MASDIQARFASIRFDEYRSALIVIQSTQGETINQLRFLSRRTGAQCILYEMRRAEIPLQATSEWKAVAETGMVLQAVATIPYNFTFERWRDSFREMFEPMPQEQQLAELELLQAKVTQQINLLKLVTTEEVTK